MRTPEELCQVFRGSGRKVTPQRLRIFEVLSGNTSHPNAESVFKEVLKAMPSVSLKTVYQTLNELEEMGEIHSLSLGKGSVRFDPNGETRHQHFVCTECGVVRDLHATRDSLPTSYEIADGFVVTNTEIVHRGTCPVCSDGAQNIKSLTDER